MNYGLSLSSVLEQPREFRACMDDGTRETR